MSRKPRADSKLKTLPEDRQAAIAEYARDHTLSDTLKWLRSDGLQTSAAALSSFLSWYVLQEQWRQDEVTTESLLEQLKGEVPNLSEEQLDDLGQRTFSLLSIRRQDLDGFVSIRSARSKAELEKAKIELRKQAEKRLQQGLELQREIYEAQTAEKLLDAALRLKADEINASGLSQADKIAAMRKAAFKDVEALQQSGKLQIPKA